MNKIVVFVLVIYILKLSKLCTHEDEVNINASFKPACLATGFLYTRPRRNAYVRKCFLKSRINYTANSLATFNPAITMLTRSGINLMNPGPERRTIKQENPNIITTPYSAHSIQPINLASCPRLEEPCITHMNCRSIIPHIDELRKTFQCVSAQFIAFTVLRFTHRIV